MWRKSSRSNGNGGTNCVEVALNGSAARVRDSKNRMEAEVAAPGWAAFIDAVKRGDLEKP
ncbi:protein of unknown function [Lentzea fradiae]|uniref:DUF397 domain-containing protein n=1 Tax=Lentzea fradiae TaxID=200378 RepID=A0A1G8DRA6_9PSEU|nr:DUF397 domain-containing protein [Lentzea fradiae]SDH60115.1 protein of unknown function [Lentzea fradiae]